MGTSGDQGRFSCGRLSALPICSSCTAALAVFTSAATTRTRCVLRRLLQGADLGHSDDHSFCNVEEVVCRDAAMLCGSAQHRGHAAAAERAVHERSWVFARRSTVAASDVAATARRARSRVQLDGAFLMSAAIAPLIIKDVTLGTAIVPSPSATLTITALATAVNPRPQEEGVSDQPGSKQRVGTGTRRALQSRSPLSVQSIFADVSSALPAGVSGKEITVVAVPRRRSQLLQFTTDASDFDYVVSIFVRGDYLAETLVDTVSSNDFQQVLADSTLLSSSAASYSVLVV
eukprot:3999653-Pleurochrysis_carterae.AAC.1